jgi:hypothetical protein
MQANVVYTWLSEPDVEDLVHLRIVGSDVKDVVGLILNAGNVDGHQILGDLLPSNRSSAAGAHVEHFSPQPATFSSHKRERKNKLDISEYINKCYSLLFNLNSSLIRREGKLKKKKSSGSISRLKRGKPSVPFGGQI